MNVLVTGGCGYIGLHLCKQLEDAGHKVRVVDKGFFPTGLEALRDVAPEAELVRADIRSVSAEVFEGMDAVCHLAGLSNDPTADFNPEANWNINYVATVALAKAAKAAGVRRFTFASSASVYGTARELGLTEDGPVNPQSHYAKSKVAAEEKVLEYADADFEPVILRQATVSGWSWRMRWDLVVNAMVRSALTQGCIRVNAGGEAYRPLIDVRDVAEVHVRLLTAEGVGGQVFNVGHQRTPHGDDQPLAEGYAIASLAIWIIHLLQQQGYKVKVVGDWSQSEGRSYDMDCSKMRKALHWEPLYGVSDMVRSILEHETNWDDPEARNIGWMTALDHGRELTETLGGVF